MELRRYQSPMIGSGTEEDPFRPIIADAGAARWESLGDGTFLVTIYDHSIIEQLPGVHLIE